MAIIHRNVRQIWLFFIGKESERSFYLANGGLPMQRTAMKSLTAWKEKKRRKPLLITGCRQCGKTWLMTEFGRRYFQKTLVFNFEKEPALAEIFRYDLDPKRILRELGTLREGKPIG